jgi:hypothetical protein
MISIRTIKRPTFRSKINRDKFAVIIFPDPTESILQVELNRPVSFKVTLAISSTLKLSNDIYESDRAEIDIKALSKGIYILKLQSSNSKRLFKIIKE